MLYPCVMFQVEDNISWLHNVFPRTVLSMDVGAISLCNVSS